MATATKPKPNDFKSDRSPIWCPGCGDFGTLNAFYQALAELEIEVHREQLRACAERGVELIWFTPPGYEGTPERLRLHEAGVIPTLFHFNDPERYPELFRLNHRYDKGHLNRRGVERLAELFADAFLEHLERKGETP